MRRLLVVGLLSLMVAGHMFAAYSLTASKVTVEDMTTDKYNFFVTVEAHTSSGEYEVAFDVYPVTRSAIGSFSAVDKTIGFVSSFVHKTKANGSAVDMWYYPGEDAAISLTIVKKDETTCTLSGSIEATRNSTTYTYVIDAYDFDYAEGPVDPEPEKDPYRFEPTEPTTVDFNADVVAFRDRDTYIEVTLNAIGDETYNWIELRLLSDTMAMPAGTYTINESGAAGSLTASKGYLGSTYGDDPCYVAIRGDREDWGQYTPYYLASGNLNVRYNEKGDTILISGTALSHNGSTINIQAKSYNMLYVEEEQPKEPEFVTLAIDSVAITYLSDQSDSINNQYVYTFSFSQKDDYPEVIVDVVLSEPMALVEGTYTLANGDLSGLLLFQDQEDFNTFFFGGQPYVFETASLTLTPAANGQWTFSMFITDTIGSEYDFSFTRTPYIVLYPEPEVDPSIQPYMDEQQEASVITVTLDTLIWDDKTVSKDGVLDIHLTQKEADVNGLRAYLHLGMYTPVSYPDAGIYPINGSEEDYTFSASLGRYGNTLIPCYLALIDDEGYAYAIWYIVSGDIALSYENEQPVLSGEGTSYFGSTVRFEYRPATQGIGQVQSDNVRSTKVLLDGQLYIIYKGTKYNVQGKRI